MQLTEALQAFYEKSMTAMPAEIKEKLQTAQARLAAGDLLQGAKKAGEKMVDFCLPDAEGEAVSLRDLCAGGKVVISFYRGDWCPVCMLELDALRQHLPELRTKSVRVVAISPQLPSARKNIAQKTSADFQMLTDHGNRVARELGIVYSLDEDLRPLYKKWGADLTELHGDDKYELPLPSTFIVDSEQTIVYAYHDIDYYKRLDPELLLKELNTVSQAE